MHLDDKGGRLEAPAAVFARPSFRFEWEEVEKVEKVGRLFGFGNRVRFVLGKEQKPKWFIVGTLFWPRKNADQVLNFAQARGVRVDRGAQLYS